MTEEEFNECEQAEKEKHDEKLRELAEARNEAKDMVKVTCYGSTKVYEREQAIREFTTAVLVCEGSERDRYCNILSDLRAGKSEAKDERDMYEELYGF